MARIVQKFGGTSVADIARIRHVAGVVKRALDAGDEVAVVVSAMAGQTNQLAAWAREISPLFDAREYDTFGPSVTATVSADAAGGSRAAPYVGASALQPTGHIRAAARAV